MRIQQKVKLYRRKQLSQFKSRRSNILWYNLPFIKSGKTNINKRFLRLISKHFPSMHNLKLTIYNEIDYLIVPNNKSKISTYNKKY